MQKIKAAYLQSVICEVYENLDDKENGIPALFDWQITFNNIDTTRLDASTLRASVEYKTNTISL